MYQHHVDSAKTVLLILFLGALPITAVADPIYVDQDATGPIHDGSSWCSAFTHLYEALRIASPGGMICIADGLYLPDTTGLIDPRDATFEIPADLTIAGAYAGCGAPDPDERDPFVYITTLSGDLAGDDHEGGLSDNTYHVVTAPAMAGPATTLGGLVIRSGNAEGGHGGGILAEGGRLVLIICTLKDNHAWRGGAIYIEAGGLHLFGCRLTDNAASGEGGAIFDATSDLEAHNCLFAVNSAGNDGGAIFSDLCSTGFFGCSFGGNVSESRGGAIYDYVGVETYAGNCIFWGNSDVSGTGESAQVFINPSNILAIDYSCVQGWTGGFGGEGNIGEDPLLADLPSGNMHLLSGSPCIDHGSNDLVGSQLDLDGNLRIVNGIVDMGCYEFQGNSSLPDSLPGCESPRVLSVAARPGESKIAVRFLPPRDGAWSLTVYSVTGRCVRLLDKGTGANGRQSQVWDGRDAAGRPVSTGVYFYALTREGYLLDAAKGIYVR